MLDTDIEDIYKGDRMARYQTQRTDKRTLSCWLRNLGANSYRPIMDHAPRVGIHDIDAIRHVRTYLWDLSDYHVECVQAGVIWLAPRVTSEVSDNA